MVKGKRNKKEIKQIKTWQKSLLFFDASQANEVGLEKGFKKVEDGFDMIIRI